jgi:hypothetical protein
MKSHQFNIHKQYAYKNLTIASHQSPFQFLYSYNFDLSINFQKITHILLTHKRVHQLLYQLADHSVIIATYQPSWLQSLTSKNKD